jgi:hypothetical protein
MRKLILVLLTGVFYSCMGQVKVDFEPHVPKHSLNVLTLRLEGLYKNQDTLGLISFFKDWAKDVEPNEIKYINQNNRIKTVYDIYKAFYKPSSPFKLGDWEAFHTPKHSLEYFVIQNRIFYSILPDNDFDSFNWKTHKIDSINNFKPNLDNLGQERILYLTSEYRNALNKFLGSQYKDMGTENVMSPELPKGESKNRYRFIKNYIHILPGHWGNYWHLETHPDVEVIVINKELTKAEIHFRYGYQGGTTVLEKRDGEWIIKSSKATWIE